MGGSQHDKTLRRQRLYLIAHWNKAWGDREPDKAVVREQNTTPPGGHCDQPFLLCRITLLFYLKVLFAGDIAQWQNTCIVCMRAWVPSPAPNSNKRDVFLLKFLKQNMTLDLLGN